MATRVNLNITFGSKEDILYQSDNLLSSVDDNDYDDLEESTEVPRDSSNRVFQSSKTKINALVWFVRILLMASGLTCLVLSKITVIKIIAELHILGKYNDTPKSSELLDKSLNPALAANLYWMLFFIVMIPNLISWIRTVLSGLLSKSPRRPWPKCTALFGVSFKMIINFINDSFIICSV